MHKSLPVTPSDKRMSKRHLRSRIKLAKASAKMNHDHKMEHGESEVKEKQNIREAIKRLRTVERV